MAVSDIQNGKRIYQCQLNLQIWNKHVFSYVNVKLN